MRKSANVYPFLALLSILSLVLGGCASGPTPEQLANADYGEPVTQEFAQGVAQAYFNRVLKDPYSAQYQWGQVEQAWFKKAPIEGGGVLFGYRLLVDVNAKNSYGGYTGYERYQFFFQNGQLTKVMKFHAASGMWL